MLANENILLVKKKTAISFLCFMSLFGLIRLLKKIIINKLWIEEKMKQKKGMRQKIEKYEPVSLEGRKGI